MLDGSVDGTSVYWKRVVWDRLAPKALAFVPEERDGDSTEAFWRLKYVKGRICVGLRLGFCECCLICWSRSVWSEGENVKEI